MHHVPAILLPHGNGSALHGGGISFDDPSELLLVLMPNGAVEGTDDGRTWQVRSYLAKLVNALTLVKPVIASMPTEMPTRIKQTLEFSTRGRIEGGGVGGGLGGGGGLPRTYHAGGSRQLRTAAPPR